MHRPKINTSFFRDELPFPSSLVDEISKPVIYLKRFIASKTVTREDNLIFSLGGSICVVLSLSDRRPGMQAVGNEFILLACTSEFSAVSGVNSRGNRKKHSARSRGNASFQIIHYVKFFINPREIFARWVGRDRETCSLHRCEIFVSLPRLFFFFSFRPGWFGFQKFKPRDNFVESIAEPITRKTRLIVARGMLCRWRSYQFGRGKLWSSSVTSCLRWHLEWQVIDASYGRSLGLIKNLKGSR